MFLIWILNWNNQNYSINGFNPLNQVYVFNLGEFNGGVLARHWLRFNPLNQVYVFNTKKKGTCIIDVIKQF